MSSEKNKVVGIILAGGEGARLHGVDKGLKHHQGKPLIKHVVDRLSPQTSHLIVSANRNLESYQNLGYPVITDAAIKNAEHSFEGAFEGPMAGTAACLQELLTNSALTAIGSDASYALLSACDTPQLPQNLSERLMTFLQQSDAMVAVAHDGQRRHNLHCLIKRQAWQALIDAYRQGARAMHRWQREIGDVEVDFSEQKNSFANLNTDNDFLG